MRKMVSRCAKCIVKRSLSSPRKSKSRKIPSACWLSLIYDGKVLTKGAIILSK